MSEYLTPKLPNTPVSPLLFVIYLSVLHIPIPCGIIFSYADDFAVTVGSLSYRLKCQMLRNLYTILKPTRQRQTRMSTSQFSKPNSAIGLHPRIEILSSDHLSH